MIQTGISLNRSELWEIDQRYPKIQEIVHDNAAFNEDLTAANLLPLPPVDSVETKLLNFYSNCMCFALLYSPGNIILI